MLQMAVLGKLKLSVPRAVCLMVAGAGLASRACAADAALAAGADDGPQHLGRRLLAPCGAMLGSTGCPPPLTTPSEPPPPPPAEPVPATPQGACPRTPSLPHHAAASWGCAIGHCKLRLSHGACSRPSPVGDWHACERLREGSLCLPRLQGPCTFWVPDTTMSRPHAYCHDAYCRQSNVKGQSLHDVVHNLSDDCLGVGCNKQSLL